MAIQLNMQACRCDDSAFGFASFSDLIYILYQCIHLSAYLGLSAARLEHPSIRSRYGLIQAALQFLC